jgi:hypothetical protein
VWRAYETAKGRPASIVRDAIEFPSSNADG